MSSSKVILLGAVSVIFGLYSLSLTRVESSAGSTAEIGLYINKAENNARTGVQRCLNLWTRQSGSYGETFTLTDPNGKPEGSFTYTVAFPLTNLGGTPTKYRLYVTSTGTYKAPSEPSSFVGHQVTRYVVAEFLYTGTLWDITQKSAYSVVSYTREHQLDSLQTLKGN